MRFWEDESLMEFGLMWRRAAILVVVWQAPHLCVFTLDFGEIIVVKVWCGGSCRIVRYDLRKIDIRGKW